MSRHAILLSYYFPPHAAVSVFRSLRFATHLRQTGWEPAVVTSDAVKGDVHFDESLLQRVPEGLVVRRCPLVRREDQLKRWLRLGSPTHGQASPSASEGNNAGLPIGNAAADKKAYDAQSFRSLVSEFLFAVPDNKIGWRHAAAQATRQLVREFGSEVIFASGPPFSVHLAALDASRSTRVPLVLDFRDPWSRDPWGRRGRSRLAKMRHVAMERTCVETARRVILNTERMADEFRRHYADLPADKFVCIPNGFDEQLYDLAAEVTDHAAQEKAGKPLQMLHPGSIYGPRDPALLLQALQQVRDSGHELIEFVQLGGCDKRGRLEQSIRELHLQDQVRLLPPVPHREVFEHMGRADVLVIIQQGTSVQVPGKFYEMLPFRKPILAFVDDGSTTDLVRKYQLGYVAPPNNLTLTTAAMRDALAAARSGVLRANFDAAIADYDARKLAWRLAQELEAVAGHPAR
jgi:glycosyltransferase involved in cell wall biosynthesis